MRLRISCDGWHRDERRSPDLLGANRMLRDRLRKLASYSFEVPWCVPQWGWREFRASLLGCLFASRSAPGAFAATAGERLGRRFTLPVARGRVAIELGLRALGVGAGDDVVLPSYVCDSVFRAVEHTGARPVFADIGPNLNVTLETVLTALTPSTRCVIVAHLFGAPAPIAAIEAALRDRGIALIDDAAQAIGATDSGGKAVGSFGAFGILSCGPGKPIAGPGGGVLLTGDRTLFERASELMPPAPSHGARRRVIRFWIWRRFRGVTLPLQMILEYFRLSPDAEEERDSDLSGLSGLEARLAMVQLARLTQTTLERRRNGVAILSALGELARYNVVSIGPGTAAMKLALVLPEDGPTVPEMIAALAEGGVESQRGYRPCHQRVVGGVCGRIDYTERTWRRVLCVPLESPLRDPGRLTRALRRLGH